MDGNRSIKSKPQAKNFKTFSFSPSNYNLKIDFHFNPFSRAVIELFPFSIENFALNFPLYVAPKAFLLQVFMMLGNFQFSIGLNQFFSLPHAMRWICEFSPRINYIYRASAYILAQSHKYRAETKEILRFHPLFARAYLPL